MVVCPVCQFEYTDDTTAICPRCKAPRPRPPRSPSPRPVNETERKQKLDKILGQE